MVGCLVEGYISFVEGFKGEIEAALTAHRHERVHARAAVLAALRNCTHQRPALAKAKRDKAALQLRRRAQLRANAVDLLHGAPKKGAPDVGLGAAGRGREGEDGRAATELGADRVDDGAERAWVAARVAHAVEDDDWQERGRVAGGGGGRGGGGGGGQRRRPRGGGGREERERRERERWHVGARAERARGGSKWKWSSSQLPELRPLPFCRSPTPSDRSRRAMTRSLRCSAAPLGPAPPRAARRAARAAPRRAAAATAAAPTSLSSTDVFVLDFDGVVGDSAREVCGSGYAAAAARWPALFPAADAPRVLAALASCRPRLVEGEFSSSLGSLRSTKIIIMNQPPEPSDLPLPFPSPQAARL